MPKKFENIQALRGVSVLLVVFCHLQIVERKYSLKEMILPDWLDYGIVSVDLFFVISGFVIATVTYGQFQSLRAARHFFIQRITRIYPVYWFYSTIVLIFWLHRPEMVNSAQGNQVNILSSFLLLPEDLLPLIMVGWTLIHEMYFYIVIAFFMPILPERAFPFLLALWALVVMIGKSYCMANPDEHYGPTLRLVFDPLTLDFIGGAAIALFLRCNIHKNGQLLMGMGIGAFLFFTIWPNSNSHLALNSVGWWRVIFFGIPSLLVVYGATSMEINGKLHFPKMIRKIGDASYSIYLSHLLVLSAIGRISVQIANSGIISHILILVAMVLATIIVGLISYRWVEIPILNVIRTWRWRWRTQ